MEREGGRGGGGGEWGEWEGSIGRGGKGDFTCMGAPLFHREELHKGLGLGLGRLVAGAPQGLRNSTGHWVGD